MMIFTAGSSVINIANTILKYLKKAIGNLFIYFANLQYSKGYIFTISGFKQS